MMKKIFLIFSVLIFLSAACRQKPPANYSQTAAKNQQSQEQASAEQQSENDNDNSLLKEPISDAISRITKKPFNIYITPKTSPVQPEKFSGFHTGTDFEIFDNEQDIDVAVYAICDGKILIKRMATGYGGILVQSCIINKMNVTVIYGHIKMGSITKNVRDELASGEQFATLGKGFSTETDGERKHLHLGIHKGTNVDIKGYVQNETQLDNWLNFEAIYQLLSKLKRN